VTVDARSALLTAAERLFADRGVDGPSLREITRAADQRNTNALQYHFGDRDGLLDALLLKHQPTIEIRRNALLDEVERRGVRDLRDISSTLVLPLVAKLDDPDGGPEYLQVVAEIVARPRRFADRLRRVNSAPSLRRWSRIVEPYLPPDAVGRPLHRRFAAIRFVHNEFSSLARERSSRAGRQLSTSHLTDLVTGLLTAPVSEETAGLLARQGGIAPDVGSP
jgi:AcrR family transcriptional regulator